MNERQMIYDEGRRRGFEEGYEEGKEYILKTMIVIPNNVEPGSETFIGEDIVVCHHDDYMNMMLDAAQWNEYGDGKADQKHGEWKLIKKTTNTTLVSCSECGKRFHIPNYCFKSERDRWKCCPICCADMKGAGDE